MYICANLLQHFDLPIAGSGKNMKFLSEMPRRESSILREIETLIYRFNWDLFFPVLPVKVVSEGFSRLMKVDERSFFLPKFELINCGTAV